MPKLVPCTQVLPRHHDASSGEEVLDELKYVATHVFNFCVEATKNKQGLRVFNPCYVENERLKSRSDKGTTRI